jgi:hypothetical protein
VDEKLRLVKEQAEALHAQTAAAVATAVMPVCNPASAAWSHTLFTVARASSYVNLGSDLHPETRPTVKNAMCR